MPSAATISRWTKGRRAIFLAKADIDQRDAELAGLQLRTDADLGITTKHIEMAAIVAFGERPSAIERLPAQGTFHRLFRLHHGDGDTAILRISLLAEQCDGAMLLDSWIADRVASVGVPVPPVHMVDLSRQNIPFDYAILGEAVGTSMAAFDGHEERTTAAVRSLGATVARLHTVAAYGWGLLDAEHPGHGLDIRWNAYLGRNLDAHLNYCTNAHLIEGGERTAAVAAIRSLPEPIEPAALLHGDLGSHNVFVDAGAISALVDWEDALIGDPAYDIAFWATFHPECRHRAFFDGYLTIRPLPADFHRRFWTSFLRVALAKTAHRLRFGYTNRPDRPPPSLRIRLALQRLGEGPCASS